MTSAGTWSPLLMTLEAAAARAVHQEAGRASAPAVAPVPVRKRRREIEWVAGMGRSFRREADGASRQAPMIGSRDVSHVIRVTLRSMRLLDSSCQRAAAAKLIKS